TWWTRTRSCSAATSPWPGPCSATPCTPQCADGRCRWSPGGSSSASRPRGRTRTPPAAPPWPRCARTRRSYRSSWTPCSRADPREPSDRRACGPGPAPHAPGPAPHVLGHPARAAPRVARRTARAAPAPRRACRVVPHAPRRSAANSHARAPSHRSASLPRRALCAAQCHLWLPTAHNCPVAAPGALAPGAGRGGGRASALLRGAGLRADEPGLLLELLENAVQDVRRGGIGLVDLVMDGAHGAHRLLDRGG